MTWTDLSGKNPGDVVTAEMWNQLVANFAAMGAGDSGAPGVYAGGVNSNGAASGALLTSDGSDGASWSALALDKQYSYGANGTSVTISLTGTYLAFGVMAYDTGPENGIGHAVIVNGSIVHQYTLETESHSLETNKFDIDSTSLRFYNGATDRNASLVVLKIA